MVRELDALARLRGESHPVILLGIELLTEPPTALVLHTDGSLSVWPIDCVKLNALETAVRFDQLEQQNTYGATEAREHLGHD